MLKNRGIWLAVLGGATVAAASVLVIFLIWGFSGEVIYVTYSRLDLTFVGSKDLWHPASFQRVDKGGSLIHAHAGNEPEFLFYWKHTPYRLDVLTTSVLSSLGFRIIPPGASITSTRAEFGTGEGDAECHVLFGFSSSLSGFMARCGIGITDPCPFGFSYGSSGEMRLPVSMEDLHRVFGKPDKIHTRPDPWLKKWFYWQFPSFAPPPVVL